MAAEHRQPASSDILVLTFHWSLCMDGSDHPDHPSSLPLIFFLARTRAVPVAVHSPALFLRVEADSRKLSEGFPSLPLDQNAQQSLFSAHLRVVLRRVKEKSNLHLAAYVSHLI